MYLMEISLKKEETYAINYGIANYENAWTYLNPLCGNIFYQ